MREDAVEPVRPQCAIGAARTHVVNDEQVFLVAEQLGQTNLAVVACELVVGDLLGFDGLPKLAQLAAQFRNLQVVASQFLRSLCVLHWDYSSVSEFRLVSLRSASA